MARAAAETNLGSAYEHLVDIMPAATHAGESGFYRIHYRSPNCFDDGDYIHDQWWADELADFEAANDDEARAIAERDHRRIESCASHPPRRTAALTRLERVARCADRVTEVPLGRQRASA